MSIINKDFKIEVKVDESVASGIFSNFVNISSSPEEIILDFLFVHPAPPPGFGKLMSRMILTPAHAKRHWRLAATTLIQSPLSSPVWLEKSRQRWAQAASHECV